MRAIPMLKTAARRICRRAASLLPTRWLEALVRRELLVFFYHTVDDGHLPHVRELYPYKSCREFEADIEFLKREYDVPGWPDLLRDGPRRGRRRAALVTFDDGMSQCFENVRPILQRHGVPAIFFVTREFVDNREMFYRHKLSLCVERLQGSAEPLRSDAVRRLGAAAGRSFESVDSCRAYLLGLRFSDGAAIDRACEIVGVDVARELAVRRPYLTTEQVRQLHAEGFTIGGHSLRHQHFRELGPMEIEREIVESCRFVADVVGAGEVPFAFPFSSAGVDRALLRSIASRNPWITGMFDTDGLAMNESPLINRIAADTPASGGRAASGLPRHLKDHYADQLPSEVARSLRGRRRGPIGAAGNPSIEPAGSGAHSP